MQTLHAQSNSQSDEDNLKIIPCLIAPYCVLFYPYYFFLDFLCALFIAAKLSRFVFR